MSTSIDYILKLKDQFSGTFNKFDKGAQGVDSKMKQMNSSTVAMGSIIATGAVAAFSAIVGGVTKAYQATARYQDLMTGFTVMLQGNAEQAKSLVNEIYRMGKFTPFESADIAEQAKYLKAMGVQTNNLIPLLGKIGDISLGNGEKFKTISTVMGQINSLGKLQGQDLKQLQIVGFNPLVTYAKRYGITMEEAQKRSSKGMISFEETVKSLMEETGEGGQFYKGMEAGANNLNAKMGGLMDTIDQMFIKIGTSGGANLFGTIIDNITYAIDWVSTNGGTIWEAFLGGSGGMLSKIKGYLGAISNALFGSGGSILSNITNALYGLFTALAPIGELLGYIFGEVMNIFTQIFGNGGGMLDTFITAIGIFAKVFSWVVKNLFDFVNWLATPFKAIIGWIWSAIKPIVGFIGKVMGVSGMGNLNLKDPEKAQAYQVGAYNFGADALTGAGTSKGAASSKASSVGGIAGGKPTSVIINIDSLIKENVNQVNNVTGDGLQKFEKMLTEALLRVVNDSQIAIQ
mgnify:CR=1 FL=1